MSNTRGPDIFEVCEALRAEVERLKALVNERYFERSLSPADLKAAEKHCDWPAFQHAWNAVMNARAASRTEEAKQRTGHERS